MFYYIYSAHYGDTWTYNFNTPHPSPSISRRQKCDILRIVV